MDEVGRSNLGDLAAAAAANNRSIHFADFAGDNKQQGAYAAGRGRNEAYKLVQRSVFSSLLEDEEKRYPVVELNEQRRMHPDISKHVSRIFYNSELVDHPSTFAFDPKAATAQEFFALKFGPAYNGTRNLAIDVSGQTVRSKPYGNTKSHCNEYEAEIIAATVEALCQFTPSPASNGTKIEPKDFLLITPYGGQESLLRQKMYGRNLFGACFDTVVDISTVSKIQGGEGFFVFISLCMAKDDPLKLGFVSHSEQICVELSRARLFQVVVGDFQRQVQALVNGSKTLLKRKTYNDMLRIHWPHGVKHQDQRNIISFEDWQEVMVAKRTLKEAGFPGLIVDPNNQYSGRDGGGQQPGSNKTKNAFEALEAKEKKAKGKQRREIGKKEKQLAAEKRKKDEEEEAEQEAEQEEEEGEAAAEVGVAQPKKKRRRRGPKKAKE